MKKKIAWGISFLLLMLATKSFAQTNIAKEQSKFIYNFTREIEWPIDYRNGNFIIRVYGSNQLYNELKAYMSDKTVAGQHIMLIQTGNVEEIDKCHVLFVGREKSQEMSAIKQKIGHSKTLIITDRKEGIRDGAGISFVVLNERLHYEISPDNIVKTGLKYSADLVDLAVDIPLASR
jgi:mRNA degradation ribonuclease J1/J2